MPEAPEGHETRREAEREKARAAMREVLRLNSLAETDPAMDAEERAQLAEMAEGAVRWLELEKRLAALRQAVARS